MKDQTIIVETIVNATVKSVWEALTVPEKMKNWYFTVNNFELRERNEFYFYEPNGTNFKHVCRIIDIVPEKRIRYSWSYPEYSNGVSIVSWQLAAQDGKTLVRLKHSGIENFMDAGSDLSRENFVAGWEEIVKKSLPGYLANQS
ncbi:SRPBCC family protein [Galbibacter pacificus]|uniref:SRPBCC domain-containing protein n=1 Tax=Galbibacter pacificus TaxID=2996052 RepID=A0ABT6FVG9_9FLAO|nr:SRPBCC domain-containing protein [Galbibacter pacificus]MDG3583819.1 SRPBCC domain-containing protein [Galbibacter pacificus]MDG3587263.1 SRPBCC domain-containing protein [Galbibacter pacificus]